MPTKPQPTERKRRRGNTGKEKLPALAAVVSLPPALGTAAPANLGPAGLELWTRAMDMGKAWVAHTDLTLLALTCELADRRVEWLRILEDDGPVLFTDKAYAYQHPIVGALNTLERELLSCLSLLGFTPSDRSRLGVAEVTAQSKLSQIRGRA